MAQDFPSVQSTLSVAVIGGGPAGLRAAEVAAAGGARVTVYDAMPSVGRKFLVAGKSGLNLTNGEPMDGFLEKYSGPGLPRERWNALVRGFDNEALRQWAAGLGVETFVASSGKVFPVPVNGMIKAAPLLRRWLDRLREMGVEFATRHRWLGMDGAGRLRFEHQGQGLEVVADRVVLALGGGSWPRTGSTGGWVAVLRELGIEVNDLEPANCGWEMDWPQSVVEEAEGLPIKNAVFRAGEMERRGEVVLTRYGLEGGPIYRLGPALRGMGDAERVLTIDFKPDLSVEDLVEKMGAVKKNYVREARRRWKLDAATCALLKHLPDRGPWRSVEQLAREVKACRIPVGRPRPLEDAISSAGGVAWSELDESLMLRKLPGVYVAGEMVDWEAPTGGYLLQGCFASGTHVGRRVLEG
ncbi:TIGR03862 family flavoprotein [Sulfuriroseicoccus oceanibius]|uniref:TIGR03862 family flavoprotein n=1 Tax=Sulfuriroseicoccus oceanibius TaxID=2707525 RepID=A0A6B3LGD5_9BACT|nr:TIGR03862 family flavoprotein [Sulfuriroseicoccus oceanibius]QQL45209.1 TIGR03862 family flavoprotein [Sulfuriroseicoccus oceanibius]